FPLSYCLLSTVSATTPGKRKRAIEKWAEQVKAKYHLNPRHIGTDKDLGEIGPCQTVWPTAKITICWWHQRKAVRERLQKAKLSTTPYNSVAAHQVFSFIDIYFIPPGKPDPWEREGGREGGGRDTVVDDPPSAERSISNNKPSLTIVLPATQSFPPSSAPLKGIAPGPSTSTQTPVTNGDANVEDENEMNAKRKFCSSEFREAVLSKMDAHRHAHPLIPGYAEPSPEGIYSWAVKRMYNFCVEHDLRELWAYLWENWYRPPRWKLWTRSPSPEIPRLRTTMINESHWRHIKHDFLHYFHKPRVDLLVWILVAKLTPTYQRKLEDLTVDKGRYRGLACWRKVFKREWKKLEQMPITLPMRIEYRPNIKRWACVEPVPETFFLEVIRIRTAPFWQHSSLIPKTDLPEGYVDDISYVQKSIPIDEHQDPQQNEPEDGNESEGEDYELEAYSTGKTATYDERIEGISSKLRNFADGLLYQRQFRDERFLKALEREGSRFFRLLDSCLEKEKRQNTNGGAPTSTWDPEIAPAMFYRTRPRAGE
ncbi:hypothetical protein EV360DRAFT_13494, partial [Lentinula raphanica]